MVRRDGVEASTPAVTAKRVKLFVKLKRGIKRFMLIQSITESFRSEINELNILTSTSKLL